MAEQQLLVEPAVVGRKLGVTELTDDQIDTVTDAILDAQADVEAALNRDSLFPRPASLQGVYPRSDDLESWRAWPVEQFDDEVTVVSSTANGDGTYDVVLLVGLDGPNTRPIVRFVTAAAAESVRNDPSSGMGARQASSVSRDGQSVSYERASSVAGAAGAAPTMKSLSRYRRHTVVTATRPTVAPWPYDGAPLGYQP